MGRSPKPFFDLPMNSGARTPARPASSRPSGLVEPKGPVLTNLPPIDAPEAADSPTKPIEFSISTLYWAAAGIMIVLLGVWILGVKAGKSDAERRLGSQLAQQQPESPAVNPNAPSWPSSPDSANPSRGHTSRPTTHLRSPAR